MSSNNSGAFKQLKLAERAPESDEIRKLISEYNAHNDPEEEGRTSKKLNNIIEAIAVHVKNVEASLPKLADSIHEQETNLRRVQAETGIYRRPARKDKLMAGVSLFACGLIEASFTTFVIAADGGAGIVSGMATGVVTTVTNIVIALIGGKSSQYIGYGAIKPVLKRSDRVKHTLGIIGSSATSIIALVMAFGAARVRVVGDHKGILDFINGPGFFETFNDHLSLGTLVIGASVYVISFMKGRSGFGDKNPLLAEIADELSNDTDADADEIVDAALDALEKFLEDAEEAQAVSAPLAVEQTDIQARIIRQLSAIEAAKDECLAVHDQEYQRECFVRARVLEFSPLPLDEFDKLAEGLVLQPRIKPSEDALEAVKAAHAEATSKILQLHADYLSNSRTFRVLPPDQSSTT